MYQCDGIMWRISLLVEERKPDISPFFVNFSELLYEMSGPYKQQQTSQGLQLISAIRYV